MLTESADVRPGMSWLLVRQLRANLPWFARPETSTCNLVPFRLNRTAIQPKPTLSSRLRQGGDGLIPHVPKQKRETGDFSAQSSLGRVRGRAALPRPPFYLVRNRTALGPFGGV